jgi:hypothetical protein
MIYVNISTPWLAWYVTQSSLNDRPIGMNPLVEIGWFWDDVFRETLNGKHWDTALVSSWNGAGAAVLEDRQELFSEGWTWITSEMSAALFPSASSNEASKATPAGRGRRVPKEPEPVELSHAELGTTKENGVELKGRMVKVRGSAAGGFPPWNETLKLPHWLTPEYVMNWKSENALRGAKRRK